MKEKLILPTVTLEHKGGQVVITHGAGTTTTIGVDRLASWALAQLRKELTLTPKLEKP